MNEDSESRFLKVGVLAIIGSFLEHINVTTRAAKELRRHCGVTWGNTEVEIVTIRTVDQIDESLDALIVPGGETTVISKFIEANNFVDRLKLWMAQQNKVGGIDITCERNGFGRQRQSHVIDIEVHNSLIQDPFAEGTIGEHLPKKPFSGVFLRAPVIKSVNSKEVEVLCSRAPLIDLSSNARLGSGTTPVGVMQDNKMATTFHPELTDDLRWHGFFLKQALARKYPSTSKAMFITNLL